MALKSRELYRRNNTFPWLFIIQIQFCRDQKAWCQPCLALKEGSHHQFSIFSKTYNLILKILHFNLTFCFICRVYKIIQFICGRAINFLTLHKQIKDEVCFIIWFFSCFCTWRFLFIVIFNLSILIENFLICIGSVSIFYFYFVFKYFSPVVFYKFSILVKKWHLLWIERPANTRCFGWSTLIWIRSLLFDYTSSTLRTLVRIKTPIAEIQKKSSAYGYRSKSINWTKI